MNRAPDAMEQSKAEAAELAVLQPPDPGSALPSATESLLFRRKQLWTVAAVVLFCLASLTPWAEVGREDLSQVVPMPPLRQRPATPRESGWKRLGESDQGLHAWQVARNARTLVSRPGQLFETGQCYPTRKMLAIGEPMITLGILGVPFALVSSDPVRIYNCVLIAGMLLAPLAMFFLVKEWTGVPAAGLVAGLLYGFHPGKIWDVNHVFIDDTTWAVCALLFAQRYCARGLWRDAVLFASFCALQLGGSFYPLVGSVLVSLPLMLWLLARYGTRHLRRLPAITALCIVAIAAYVVLGPFVTMRSEGVLVHRSLQYFGQWEGLLPGGGRFPGWIAVGLAAISLASLRRHTWRSNPQLFLVVACALVACSVITGSNRIQAPPIYAALARVVPGLDSIRRPNEILAGFHLAFTILAGLGCGELLRRLPRSIAPSAAAVLVLVSFATMVRPVWLGWALPGERAPVVFRTLELRPRQETLEFFEELAKRGSRGPIAEIPDGSLADRTARVFASGYHQRPTSACVNARPREPKKVRALLAALPASEAIAGLRDMGFTTIVAHHPPGRVGPDESVRALADAASLEESPIEVVLESPALTAYGIRPEK